MGIDRDREEAANQKLKNAVTTFPVLAYQKICQGFIIEVDECTKGLVHAYCKKTMRASFNPSHTQAED